MLGWFYPLELGRAQKQQIDGLTQEILTTVKSKGVVQPLSAQQLAIKPEGQRAWIWLSVYCLPDLVLQPSDIIVYNCLRYRVMAKHDYTMHGFIHYEIVEDYQEAA